MDIFKFVEECENKSRDFFKTAEDIAFFNQKKILEAFRKNRIALRHFAPSTGYAYDDPGRAALSRLFADTFKAENAIVSPLFASGTHTITTALFGLLRPGDTMLSVTGEPYDTLTKVIDGNGVGSLKEFGINYQSVKLTKEGYFDIPEINSALKKINPAIVYIQRAKGYTWRRALNVEQINKAVKAIKHVSDTPVIVDNCYGEFAEKNEPTEAGANLIIGSLIKNPGGGLAPTGGYIAGDTSLIKRIEGRYSAPGVGFEIGAYPLGYQYFFQGFFMAPHTVLQALKTAILFAEAFGTLGYEVLGRGEMPNDITCAIKFRCEDELISFCRAIQRCSPVDSFVVPHAWDMPGYDNKIIMAAGSFVQGSSIELSADAPIREPYIAYMQGSLTYEHARLALQEILSEWHDKI